MAAEDLSRIRRVPGRLSIGPTSLVTAYPHGGTAVGVVNDIAIEVVETTVPITAEEYGTEVVDVLYTGTRWGIAALLRQVPDDDVIQRVFPSTVVGAVTGARVVQHPGTTRAGTLLSANVFVLMFTPDDPRAPHVIFHRVIPQLAERVVISLALNREVALAVSFTAIRAADGRAVSIGDIQDLVL